VPKVLPKRREWISIFCSVKAIDPFIHGFYLFKRNNLFIHAFDDRFDKPKEVDGFLPSRNR